MIPALNSPILQIDIQTIQRLSIRMRLDQTVQFNQELVRPCMFELV